ncbi:Fic family protein [uncultured Jannaschia sp.]|uniref:Fic family protein n=1 Tax=uncultured Jannaschia sp. TaxID=293347 RepID=UPI003420FD0E
MILFELTNTENHPVYKSLEVENGDRQYAFVNSVAIASRDIGRPFLSQHVIKALNYHAIACLHISAGEYRPCEVRVGQHQPPPYYRVPALMDDFVNQVNRHWNETDPVVLATYVLWRLNNIHPFVNGNGRTARAACYFVLCLALGRFPQGKIILPQLIKQNRPEYVEALQKAHVAFAERGEPDLNDLHALVVRLLGEQIASA